MSTRKAKDDSILYQQRYASSAEFERGLLANLVAKRCALLGDKRDRELIWFVQYLSHKDGGLAHLAADLLAKFPSRLGTPAMCKNRRPVYSADDVKKIRSEIPKALRGRFPLCGETSLSGQVAPLPYELRMLMAEQAGDRLGAEELAVQEALEIANASQLPKSYPATAVIDLCREAAEKGFDDAGDTDDLETELGQMCLNPAWRLTDGPWYFADLVAVLREYQESWIKEKSQGVVTALGRQVCDTLNYTAFSRKMALMQGDARTGKSFAARAWCEQHPGRARFVEVPPGNDEVGFFRALARSLGLGNFLKYKANEIWDRVESVLLTGDLILVLDEAQRLWPQMNLRYGYPHRIVRIMSLANAGVPIAMVATPQFLQVQKAVEKTGWNSAQLIGRINRYVPLPGDLSHEDLMAVAKAWLPEVDAQVLRTLALYARQADRYLAAIEAVATNARYLALNAGRNSVTTEDAHKALKEFVVPADTSLRDALAGVKKAKPDATRPATASAAPQAEAEDDTPTDPGAILPSPRRANPDRFPRVSARRRSGKPETIIAD